MTMGHTGIVQDIPEDLKLHYAKAELKHLIKTRLLEKRWRFRPNIPSCVMGNVNSLASTPCEEHKAVQGVQPTVLYRDTAH